MAGMSTLPAWPGALRVTLFGVIAAGAAAPLIIFLDVVSRQPDKIAAFHNSGYHSMRESINAGLFTGAIFGIPFVTLVGASAGALGALISRAVGGGGRQSLQRPTTAS